MTSHYLVMAQVCEPNYDKELQFLKTELDFVERKLASKGPRLAVPSLGFFGRDDWRGYKHKLEAYARQLERYSDETDAGVIPVRFMVYNSGEIEDAGVHVRVHVTGGRIDETRKAPARPDRLDGHGGGLPQLVLPKPGFSRRDIKVTAHAMSAVLSDLGPHDGAALANQLVHLHLNDGTEVKYEVMSRNTPQEAGEVELVEAKAATT